MGAGASMLQSDSKEETSVIDLDTFVVVQEEYRRLSCGEATDDAAEATTPTDEEVFMHLKSVVAHRLEHKQLTAKEDDANTTDEVASDGEVCDGPSLAEIKDTENEGRAAMGTDRVSEADAKDLEAHAKQDDESEEAHAKQDEESEDDAAVRMLQRPLTTDSLRALAATIPDDLPKVDSFHSVVSGTGSLSSSGSHGRLGMSSTALTSMSSASSNSGSGSTFDLTQNLTPVFTTDVLTDPTTLKMITGYADREQIPHGGDWIKFWVEIDAVAQLPSHSYTHRRLRKIYDKFLSPEAPSPVCVTSSMLAEIETALQGENISAGIYVDAQQICLTALEQSVYPRFRESRLFKRMMEFCAPPQGPTTRQHQQELLVSEDYSLAGILTHPAKLRFLKTYCMEALALENLLFYLEVEDCKRLPNLSFIVNKTRKVYDRYCTPTSKCFLHFPDAVFADLHAATEAGQPLLPKLFYEAQLVAFQRISDEIWKGFYRTSEYLEYSRKLRHEHRKLPSTPRSAMHKISAEQSEQLQKKLDAMNEFQLIEAAMQYPVTKLIPHSHDRPSFAVVVEAVAAGEPVFTPAEQLTILLSDTFGKKYLKQFMQSRGVDHFLAFCHEIDDFKLLPGIEFLQHTAKKIYRKYILPSAKMQVDMSRAMRDEIGERLLNPSIDMFKRIAQRVRHGLLQDAMPRFVKSSYYSELKKMAKQFKEASVEADLKAIDAAAKKGKLELAHLDSLLQNQLSMKQLRLFLESQHCAENLMLYEEIEHFRRLPSYQIVLRSAKKIYDKYLNSSNTRNPVIPISEALRSRVLAQLDAASRTTFDEVERECTEFMRNVVVPDFLDSRIFMALVGAWAVVDDEYPGEMLKGEFEMAFLRHRFHLVQEARGLSRMSSSRSPINRAG